MNMNKEEMEQYHKNRQEKCSHEFVTYETCCYCGFCRTASGEVVHPYAAADKKELADKFSEWYFGIKDQTGKPPLAMQIFYWFSQRTEVRLHQYSDEVRNLERILSMKENERAEWANLAIRKQTIIEEMRENLILGNATAAFDLATSAVKINNPLI